MIGSAFALHCIIASLRHGMFADAYLLLVCFLRAYACLCVHVPCNVLVRALCVLLCRVVSCRVVSCRVVSCRVVSCRVVSCRAVPCRAVSCRVVSCRVVSCRVVSCRVVSCRVVSCRVVPCRVVSCRVVSCRVVSWAWLGLARIRLGTRQRKRRCRSLRFAHRPGLDRNQRQTDCLQFCLGLRRLGITHTQSVAACSLKLEDMQTKRQMSKVRHRVSPA